MGKTESRPRRQGRKHEGREMEGIQERIDTGRARKGCDRAGERKKALRRALETWETLSVTVCMLL
jgi:hypothetical protein